MSYKVFPLLIILLFPVFHMSAQSADSLYNVLDTARGTEKVKTLNELFRARLEADPVSALSYTRQAMNLASEIGDKKGIAASYNNLGVAYRNQGALDNALEYYITALRLYEELENKEGIATLKNNIANIYAMKKEYGQALRYLQESNKLFVEMEDKTRIIGSMNNLGNLNLDLQLYEKAMKNYSEAYQLSVQNGAPFADPLNNIGNIYFSQGNYQKAIENYEKAFAIAQTNNSRLTMLNIITNIGIAYSKAQQPQRARKYLIQAEGLAIELQAYTYMPPILKYNADVLYHEGKMKEAYEMLTQYDSLREKIYGEESTRKIAQMEMVLNFQEKEKELEMLQKEDEIKSLQLRNSRLFIVMVILIVLVAIGVINLYFMGNRRKLFDAASPKK